MLPKYDAIEFLYSSTDYEAFKFIGFNRRIDPKHVERLEQEIIDGAEMTPGIVVIVEDEMFIADHQHTFFACKRQKVPFTFVIRQKPITIKDLASMNSKIKKWTIENFINAWEMSGCKGFTILKEFMYKYELSIDVALSILHIDTSSKSGLPSIRDGSIHVKLLNLNWKKIEEVVFMIKDIQSRWLNIETKSFIRACIRLVEHSQYNHNIMLNKLKIQSDKIVKCSVTGYNKYLEDFYNYNLTLKNRVEL